MIGLLIGFLMFGLAGVLAFYAVVAIGALITAPFYWEWRLARFLVGMVVVAAIGLYEAATALAGFAGRDVVMAARVVEVLAIASERVNGSITQGRALPKPTSAGTFRLGRISRAGDKDSTLNPMGTVLLAPFASGDTLAKPESWPAHYARRPPGSEAKLDRPRSD